MKAITEEILRYELRSTQPEVYTIPAGKILTPAAREYLAQRKIKIEREGGFRIAEAAAPKTAPRGYEEKRAPEEERTRTETEEAPQGAARPSAEAEKPRYVDFETGAYYYQKPEHMTQLFGNSLVAKDHPRILFRGKLDSLQALVVLAQAEICAGGKKALAEELGDILRSLREIMRCDVLDEELRSERIIGLTHEELRERSHNPMKFYNIRQMVLPDYGMGVEYARLNQLRAAVREAEVAACAAFREGKKYGRGDIIEELNRLSSAMHIMMCKYLAGDYTG